MLRRQHPLIFLLGLSLSAAAVAYDGDRPLACGVNVNCDGQDDVTSKMAIRWKAFSAHTPYSSLFQAVLSSGYDMSRPKSGTRGISEFRSRRIKWTSVTNSNPLSSAHPEQAGLWVDRVASSSSLDPLAAVPSSGYGLALAVRRARSSPCRTP